MKKLGEIQIDIGNCKYRYAAIEDSGNDGCDNCAFYFEDNESMDSYCEESGACMDFSAEHGCGDVYFISLDDYKELEK